MPRQGNITAAVALVLFLVLGPAGPVKPRNRESLSRSTVFFCLSPPLLVFLWDDKKKELILYVTNQQPQSSSYLV